MQRPKLNQRSRLVAKLKLKRIFKETKDPLREDPEELKKDFKEVRKRSTKSLKEASKVYQGKTKQI